MRPAELRALIDHKLLYINAHVGIVSACKQLWDVYCAPDWSGCSVCVPVMSVCLCGFLCRDSPAEKTCALYVNVRPVYCMHSFILHIKRFPDFPPALIILLRFCRGRGRGIVPTCSAVLTTFSEPLRKKILPNETVVWSC